jgi:hypothetical protein
MAILTNANYKDVRSYIYRNGQGKEELKSLPNLPNEATLKAGFQALENKWDAERLGFKNVLDAAFGFTTSAALAQFFFIAWLQNRMRRGL